MATPLRALGRIEQAFTIMNRAFPLTAVGVIKLANGPSPEQLRKAVDRLQQEHACLRVAIRQEGSRFYFYPLAPNQVIPLDVQVRQGDQHWREAAAKMLNEAFDEGRGPLMRFQYLVSESLSGECELLVTYHHAIGDALSGVYCLHQLLTWCAAGNGEVEEGPVKVQPYELPPAAEALFPPAFQGRALGRSVLPFLGRQLWDEFTFRTRNIGSGAPAIPNNPANGILTLTFDPETSRRLITGSRRQKVTVAGLLASALLLAVWEKRHAKRKGVFRVVVFADLRPYLKPPLAVKHLGCYNSMLRFSQNLDGESSLWSVANSLSQQIYRSGKRGERFMSAFLSKDLAAMTLRQADRRLGTVGISYIGPVDLQSGYGGIRVRGIHGFVTNNPLGAEFAAFGKMIGDRIELDLQFLLAEMDPPEAAEIARKIEDLLISALNS